MARFRGTTSHRTGYSQIRPTRSTVRKLRHPALCIADKREYRPNGWRFALTRLSRPFSNST
jgi:hypothetical protein